MHAMHVGILVARILPTLKVLWSSITGLDVQHTKNSELTCVHVMALVWLSPVTKQYQPIP